MMNAKSLNFLLSTILLSSFFGLSSGCSYIDPQHHSETVSYLFQEDSIDGWYTLNGGEWTVENGVFSGSKAADIDKHCLLISEQSFDDFHLSLEYKAIHGNSGFYFRLQPAKNGLGFKGYHAEIDAAGNNASGIYDVAVDWLIKPDEDLVKEAFKPGQWNQMQVFAIGHEVSVWLNGREMSKIRNHRSEKGKLGFQLHAGENTQIQLRNLRVSEL